MYTCESDTSNDILDFFLLNNKMSNRFTVSNIIHTQSRKIVAKVIENKTNLNYLLKIKYVSDMSYGEKKVYDILINNKCCNVENIKEIFYDGDFCYLLSEYVKGYNLADFFALNKPTREDLDKLFIGLTKAISFIHAYNIVHSDIKLENIIYSGDHVVLIDFDLAKICDTYIISKCLCGSDNYMAPESFDMCLYSKWSDIWSVGICFYKLITGTFPYKFKISKVSNMYIRNNFKFLDFGLLQQHFVEYGSIINVTENMLKFNDTERSFVL